MTQKTKLLAFFNYKGGVGKTLLSTTIATFYKKMGKTVVFYDLDPQSTSSYFFDRITKRYVPDEVITDFKQAFKTEKPDYIMIDCPPNQSFIPPKDFIIISPTFSTRDDLHSFRKIKELEEQGYTVLKVINHFTSLKRADKELLEMFDTCAVINANQAIINSRNEDKTIFESKEATAPRVINQFNYLIDCIEKERCEKLTYEQVKSIMLTGDKDKFKTSNKSDKMF